MNLSAGAGPKGDINITPLVDVVLVLLIIFMVAVPLLQMGYPVQVPPKLDTPAPPSQDQLIVRMDQQGLIWINKTQIPAQEFSARLSEVLSGRKDKVIFFAADGDLSFEKVADFMDTCRDAGAENLGIVFDDLRQPAAGPTT
jgi:biopolymer transport protein ExbD